MWFFKFYDSSQGRGQPRAVTTDEGNCSPVWGGDTHWPFMGHLLLGQVPDNGSKLPGKWLFPDLESGHLSICQNAIKHASSPVCLSGLMCVCLLRQGVQKCCWEVPRLAFHGHVSSHIFTGIYLNRGETSVFISFPKTSGRETVPARGSDVRVRLDSLWKLPSTPHTS